MTSKRKLSKNKGLLLAIVLAIGLCGSALAEKKNPARYMVQLGTFKTTSGVRDAYYSIPHKLRSHALVCRSGAFYTVRCGASEKAEEVDAIFKKFKEMGLEAMVVKGDPRLCVPAEQFLKGQQQRAMNQGLPAASLPRAHQAPGQAQEAKPYADLSDPKVRQFLRPGGVRVMPETATKVVLSNRDVNRITCSEGPIKDIIYSKEKGISVKTEKDDAFVKFLIRRDPVTGGLLYATAPSEFYVVCGPDSVIYTLIALPRNVPAQSVQLASVKSKIKKNISIFKGLPFEKKVVLLVKSAFRDDIPESFTVVKVGEALNVFRHINVTLNRTVTADGEGLMLKEYILSLKESYPGQQRKLKETFFLVPELAERPVGIALEKLVLRKGQKDRLFIVERHID